MSVKKFGAGIFEKATSKAKGFGKIMNANGSLQESMMSKGSKLIDLSSIDRMSKKTGSMMDEAGKVISGKESAFRKQADRLSDKTSQYTKKHGGDAFKDIADMGDSLGEEMSKVRGSIKDLNEAKSLSDKWSAMKGSGLYKNNIDMAGSVAKSYYTADPQKGMIRGATTVGAYAGANVAGRAISGGSVTHNNKGEKDIAGIPFV